MAFEHPPSDLPPSLQLGIERTEAEYADLSARAGFRLTRVVPTLSPMSVIEAVPV